MACSGLGRVDWRAVIIGSAFALSLSSARSSPIGAPDANSKHSDSTSPRELGGSSFIVRGVELIKVDGHQLDSPLGIEMQRRAASIVEKLQSGQSAAVQTYGGDSSIEPHKLADGSFGVSLSDLQSIALDLTIQYQKKGQIATQAIVPAQQISEGGVVRIVVIEGRVSRILIDPPAVVGGTAVAKAVSGLKGKTPDPNEVDSDILLARETSGIRSVNGVFKRGQQTGDTDLLLNVQSDPRVGATVAADDYGTKSTGRYRIRESGFINEPFQIGDRLDLSAIQTFDPLSPYGAINYQAQLGIPQLVGFVGGGHNSFSVGTAAFQALDLKGSTNSATSGLQWKMLRSRFESVDSRFFIEYRDSSVTANLGYLKLPNIDLVKDRTATLNVQLSVNGVSEPDSIFGKAVDQFSIHFRQGVDALGAQSTESPERRAQFFVMGLDWSRMQVLGRDEFLVFNFSGQFTQESLVPVEQFGVGGPTSARAYEVSQVLGDRGLLAQLEYRQRASFFGDAEAFGGRKWRDLLTLKTFVDYGKVMNVGPNAAQAEPQDDKVLADAGLGFVFELPDQFSISTDAATRIGTYKDPNGDDRLRVFTEISYSF